MAGESRAEAVWRGSLAEGAGSVRLASGAAPELNVSWKARVERDGTNMTSPEELIAAAHAACFSMALSNALTQQGHPPRELDVTATATFAKSDSGFGISRIRLQVVGDVPGIDAAAFQQAAQGAKEGCPVSKALKGNVPIELEAKLKG